MTEQEMWTAIALVGVFFAIGLVLMITAMIADVQRANKNRNQPR